MAYPQAGVDVRDLPHPPPGAFAEQSTHSPSPYAPPHVQGQLTLLPGLYLQSPFESHEINLLAQRILRISITIFVWSTLNTIVRLALETAYNDNDAGSIIFVNLIVIGLGAVILGVGIKGVKARNEPCHCCCCATWLDAYKILTIVQMVFCSFDLILSVAAVAFGGQGYALINVAYFAALLIMLVMCLNDCNRLLACLRAANGATQAGVQMVPMMADPYAYPHQPPPTYTATVYADRDDEVEPATGTPVSGYPVYDTPGTVPSSTAPYVSNPMHPYSSPYSLPSPTGGGIAGGGVSSCS